MARGPALPLLQCHPEQERCAAGTRYQSPPHAQTVHPSQLFQLADQPLNLRMLPAEDLQIGDRLSHCGGLFNVFKVSGKGPSFRHGQDMRLVGPFGPAFVSRKRVWQYCLEYGLHIIPDIQCFSLAPATPAPGGARASRPGHDAGLSARSNFHRIAPRAQFALTVVPKYSAAQPSPAEVVVFGLYSQPIQPSYPSRSRASKRKR